MYLWLIPLCPLIGFLLNGLLGKRLPKFLVNLFAIGSVAASLGLVAYLLSRIYPINSPLTEHYFTWIQSGALNAGFDLTVDRLTAVMLAVVTGVGFLIHVYAMGYMADEEGYGRFFAYMNLFMFFMLLLVLASNLLLVFVGWEGVGLCSYLLVGFYFKEKFAGDAANKAFIVNRIGDFGFLLGIFLLVSRFGTLDFTKLAAAVKELPVDASLTGLGLITLLLFVGACGKSAQLPLYVWLPDAMAGPTPVSALIHAATMVTAGVYMVARMAFLYDKTPGAMHIVAIVGLATAVFAATIGLAQNDIKKVFAYSTVSQLGYMFLAVGLGAYSAGIFHLMTHAFFKALLFLGAGSVIHGLGGEQDLRHMGGLRKAMPVTFLTLLVASLAISGVPGLSGFYSKDAILATAWAKDPVMFWIAAATAGLTAFYVFRAFFLAFFGKYRGHLHPHESPLVMTLPLIVLAGLSIGGGFLNVLVWLEPMFHFSEPESSTPMLISVAFGTGGILLAFLLYVIAPSTADSLKSAFRPINTLLANKYYIDELYSATIVRPLTALSRVVLWRGVDQSAIDNGLVNGLGHGLSGLGSLLRRWQSGSIRSYATWVLAGSLLLIFVLGLAKEGAR